MSLDRARGLLNRLAGRRGHARPEAGSGDSDGATGERWVCTICGYIYDPALNEGVAFENLPPDWRCPGCGFDRSVFRRQRS